jgi:beta-galactosidase
VVWSGLALATLAPAEGVAPRTPTIELRIGSERRLDFNRDWRFLKAEAVGAQRLDFEDAGWRLLDVPHDWAVEGPFDQRINPHSGGLPYFGVGWYRRHFRLPESGKGSYFSVDFDGAMSNSRVWLNGVELGGRPYGYIGFAFDLTPHLRFGEAENVLAVRLAPEDQSSRWYPGAGIYRHVWLDITGPIHVARWGTYVRTPEVTDARATVDVRTELRNRRGQAARITVATSVLDSSGQEVAGVHTDRTLPRQGTAVVEQRLVVPRPERWDIDHPRLYRAVSVVKEGSATVDRYETRFGIRHIAFDPVQGFELNGRRRRLQGVCLHHDLGALGTAVSRRATERQLQIMKAMGANAIRTSHNPPSPELLDVADELGLVVMDEAFDMWGKPKLPNGHGKYFGEWGETDLRDMIRRDRNHPSVVLWSVGNEILEQSDPEGWKVAQRLTAICHEEDPTRPVTAALNQAESALANGLAAELDVPGFNYQAPHYPEIAKDHPHWTIVASETASCVSSRGVYHLPLEKYEKHPSRQLTSYDVISPPWAYAPDVEFEALQKTPRILGEFVWTGFDYLGEPTPYFDGDKPRDPQDWPARSSYFGIVDLAGFPKDRYFLYQSVWTQDPMVHLLPHWTWPGRGGQSIPVMAYSNADSVELFLNGRSLGRKLRGGEPVVLPVGEKVSPGKTFATRFRLRWDVPYRPGKLKALAFRGGQVVASDEVRTAGVPARVVLVPDRSRIAPDGEDLSFVTVRVEDRDGNLCPEADNLVRFALMGPGRIAGVDNGNPATVEPFQARERKAFHGLALLIVRADRGSGGAIRITAVSDGLEPADRVVTAAATP